MYDEELLTVEEYPTLMQPCMLRLSRDWQPSNRSPSLPGGPVRQRCGHGDTPVESPMWAGPHGRLTGAPPQSRRENALYDRWKGPRLPAASWPGALSPLGDAARRQGRVLGGGAQRFGQAAPHCCGIG